MSRPPRLHVAGLPVSGRVALPEEEGRHLAKVLRARPGDACRVFDGKGREVECVVASVDRDGVVVEILRDVETTRPAREVVLVAAIPRGERMEWLVEKATEAGVAAIVPLAAHRSVRQEAGDNVRRRWARAAVEAAKQCGRADVPEIAAPTTLADALTRTSDATRLVATPGATTRVGELVGGAKRVALFVGPEGGFEDAETAALAEAGARPFGLGPLILRVETAAVVAVHQATN